MVLDFSLFCRTHLLVPTLNLKQIVLPTFTCEEVVLQKDFCLYPITSRLLSILSYIQLMHCCKLILYQMMMSYFKGTADAVAEYCSAVSCPNAPNTF